MKEEHRTALAIMFQKLIKDIEADKIEMVNFNDNFPVHTEWKNGRWKYSRIGCIRNVSIGLTYYPKGESYEERTIRKANEGFSTAIPSKGSAKHGVLNVLWDRCKRWLGASPT